MFKRTKEQMIWITRGDSAKFSVEIDLGKTFHKKLYSLQEGDAVYFAIMEPNQKFEDAIVKKAFTTPGASGVNIIINPNDTEHLAPGQYWYEIRLQRNTGEVDTIVQKRKFFIED